jgi:hypothetical protein
VPNKTENNPDSFLVMAAIWPKEMVHRSGHLEIDAEALVTAKLS